MTRAISSSAAGAAAPAAHRTRSFDTPSPVSVSVEIFVGNVDITATHRRDTVVEVLPSRPGLQWDVTAAEQTTVDRTGNLIAVRGPHRWTRYILPWAGRESVDLHISLPVGSELRVDAGKADVRCSGRIGESQIVTGFGTVRIDEVGPLQVHTGFGDLSVERVAGRIEAKTGSGALRIGAIEGAAVIRNSNGDTWIGEVSGDLEVRAANGRIVVDHADAGVTARTANGAVLLGEVARGAVVAQTSAGRIEVGVQEGVAAWLDLHTCYGNISNDLEGGGPPGPGEGTVEIHARTSAGDITIRRSQLP
jgi:hypothetical protein